MKRFKLFPAFVLSAFLLYACHSGDSTTSLKVPVATGNSTKRLTDTNKLKSDMGNMMNSIVDAQQGKAADTNKLKAAMSDMGAATTSILSDSGIDKMGGSSNDPAVKTAKDAMKKMRNGLGITPAALDSMKKQMEKLGQTHH
ncbi:MAG: hypothetical protein JWR50_725 [Mucilaginibacter sp.]|nr:hypothetical protein [Mucilaginibacter sp.]